MGLNVSVVSNCLGGSVLILWHSLNRGRGVPQLELIQAGDGFDQQLVGFNFLIVILLRQLPFNRRLAEIQSAQSLSHSECFQPKFLFENLVKTGLNGVQS